MHTFLREVRQGPVLKPIRDSLATNGLLANAGYHLGYVDEGSFGATQGHGEGTVGAVQFLLTRLASRLSDH